MTAGEAQKSSALTTLLGEAVVLAATSVAAYLVAYAFETGYAAHFGYPNYLIDVGFTVALTAWTAILGVALVVFSVAMNAAFFVPAGATVALIRATYPFLFFLGAGIYALNLLGDVHWLFGLIVGGLAMGFAGLGLIDIARATRVLRPPGMSRTAYWNGIADVRRSREKPWVPDNVTERIFSGPRLGLVVAWLWLIGFGGMLALFSAKLLGQSAASRQVDFLVIHDSLDYVVVRRFPNYLIATQLIAPDTVSTCFRVYALPPGDAISMEKRQLCLTCLTKAALGDGACRGLARR